MLKKVMLVSILFLLVFLINSSHAEVFNWESKAKMPIGRFGHVSVSINEKVYIIGGFDVNGQLVSEVHAYDPSKNNWVTNLSPIPTPRLYAAASVYNGKIYIFGGYYGNNNSGIAVSAVEAYDPLSDSWETGLAQMPTPRIELSASPVAIDGIIYVMGGVRWPNPNPVDLVEGYVPDNDSWITTFSPIPTATHNATCAEVGKKIYVFGGFYFLDTVQVFDPATNSWKSSTNSELAPMPTGRSHLSSAVIGPYIYVMGGTSSYQSGSLDIVEAYNTATDTWNSDIPSMPTRRNYLSASAVGNKIYAMGGNIASYGPTDVNEVLTLGSAVAIDIKPGSCPNPVNTKSKGVLPVALLGTQDFDVTEVDPASVRLEGVAPLRSSIEDVATPYEPLNGKENADHCNDYGSDGFRDLVLKFDTQELLTTIGDVNDGDVLVLELTGELFDRSQVEGEDVIIIRKK